MLTRPDSQSFTRLIISAGVFLVVAAFVVPGLILRDTGVLTISRERIQELTPTASEEVSRRQGIAHDAGRAAPYLGAAFFGLGCLLIALGVPRLKRQEDKDEERSAMELDKLRAELRPQTAEEREERLRDEVEPLAGQTELLAEEAVVDSTGGEKKAEVLPEVEKDVRPPRPELFPPFLRARARAEIDVLARLAEIVPPSYELQTQVKLKGEPALLFDALFISQVDQLPDIVVEIKFAGAALTKNLNNRMMEAESLLLRYTRRFRRQSIGWLIVVAEEGLSAAEQEAIAKVVTKSADVLHVSVVTPDGLDRLVLPVDA